MYKNCSFKSDLFSESLVHRNLTNEPFLNQRESVLELISMFWPADTFTVVNSMLEGWLSVVCSSYKTIKWWKVSCLSQCMNHVDHFNNTFIVYLSLFLKLESSGLHLYNFVEMSYQYLIKFFFLNHRTIQVLQRNIEYIRIYYQMCRHKKWVTWQTSLLVFGNVTVQGNREFG